MSVSKKLAYAVHLWILIIAVLSLSIALVISSEALSPMVSAKSIAPATYSVTGNAQRGVGIFRTACADCHHTTDETHDSQRKLKGIILGKQGTSSYSVSRFWQNASDLHYAIGKASREHSNAGIDEHEVYDLTAYLLHMNGFVSETEAIDKNWLVNFQPNDGKGFGTVWPKR